MESAVGQGRQCERGAVGVVDQRRDNGFDIATGMRGSSIQHVRSTLGSVQSARVVYAPLASLTLCSDLMSYSKCDHTTASQCVNDQIPVHSHDKNIVSLN